MISIAALTAAINTKIAATSALSALVGRTAFGYTNVDNPKCHLAIVGDVFEAGYQHKLMTTIRMQFSVFADTIKQASDIQTAIGNTFHAASLSLATGEYISGQLSSGTTLLVEGELPGRLIYHAITIVEFRVTG